MFAKAEFTNLNFTHRVRILFVKSEVEMDLRKRNRFFTKYLTGRKKTLVGIICGVFPRYYFYFVSPTIFLGPTNFMWNRICEFRFRKHSI